MKDMEKGIKNLEALAEEATRLVNSLVPEKTRATLLTLSGELGAGKTTFTQMVAKALGCLESITSPTFVIVKTYTLPERGEFKRLVHIDAYRLSKETNLGPIGLIEILNNPENLVLLEWPENIGSEIFTSSHRITFTVLPDTTRTITYEETE